MADIVRIAKSASDWTRNELDAYNVKVAAVSAASFFGHEPRALPRGTDEFRTTVDRQQARSDAVFELLRLLSIVTSSSEAYEATVDQFALELLKVVGYVTRTRTALIGVPMDLLICGEIRSARADLSLFSDDGVALLVQEDKRPSIRKVAEAQLVAEAVAAFQGNNSKRSSELGQAELGEELIPGIIMVGACPAFYKVRVTSELAHGVATGTFPPHETLVQSCTPQGGEHWRMDPRTMKDLECRELALKYFEAFKQFIRG